MTPSIATSVFLVLTYLRLSYAGLLGAGHGSGSCAAFPNRTPSVDLDHIAGCPRYAECCSEFGYCHSRESWESGYFRDCNGESNGQPLEGSAIREEAIEEAKGQGMVSAQFLGISSEIWTNQVNKAVQILSSSSSSSSSSLSSSSSGFSSSSGLSFPSRTAPTGFTSLSSSSLVAQILAAIQPQVAQAVQSSVAASQQSVSGNRFTSNSVDSSLLSNSFDSSQFSNTLDSSQFSNTLDSSQFSNSLGSSQFSNNLDSSSSSFGTSSSSQDISSLVSLIINQLRPEIVAAVQNSA